MLIAWQPVAPTPSVAAFNAASTCSGVKFAHDAGGKRGGRGGGEAGAAGAGGTCAAKQGAHVWPRGSTTAHKNTNVRHGSPAGPHGGPNRRRPTCEGAQHPSQS